MRYIIQHNPDTKYKTYYVLDTWCIPTGCTPRVKAICNNPKDADDVAAALETIHAEHQTELCRGQVSPGQKVIWLKQNNALKGRLLHIPATVIALHGQRARITLYENSKPVFVWVPVDRLIANTQIEA
jgi:hypothetical protein